jgi:hypothetical protein
MPVLLPEGWERSEMWFGTVLHWRGNGFVTVSERKRSYSLGHGSVNTQMTGYTGRGWKDRLYADAIKTLIDAVERK